MASKIRVGFVCGKDTDFVEHPGKGPRYSDVGDPSFLADFPNLYRVDPASHEYLKDCPPGTKGQAHVDCAIAWYIKKKHGKDIDIDIITPDNLSAKRLAKNDLNFTLGYNMVNISIEAAARGATPESRKIMFALQKSPNLFPTWEHENFIFTKSNYLKAAIKAGVPVAPTIFAPRGSRSPAKLLKEIKDRGWQTFVMKQSESGFCLGFCKLSVKDCEKKPKLLEDYFRDWAHISEYIVQECIDGFTRNWETRCMWFNGKFQYAIANKAAVSTKDGKEAIVTGNDIPREFLLAAKRIGEQAIKVLPKLRLPGGGMVDNIMLRTDIGCSDSKVYDKDYTHWDPTKRTFFLNEIEPSSTTYFARWLKFDCLPLWGDAYAQKAREIHRRMKGKAVRAKGAKAKAAAPAKATAKTAKAKVTSKTRAMKTVMKVSKLKARR